MVSTYWVMDEMLDFACEIRGATAKFCEDDGIMGRVLRGFERVRGVFWV